MLSSVSDAYCYISSYSNVWKRVKINVKNSVALVYITGEVSKSRQQTMSDNIMYISVYYSYVMTYNILH